MCQGYRETQNPGLWAPPGVLGLHSGRAKQQTGTHQRCQKLAGAANKNKTMATAKHRTEKKMQIEYLCLFNYPISKEPVGNLTHPPICPD